MAGVDYMLDNRERKWLQAHISSASETSRISYDRRKLMMTSGFKIVRYRRQNLEQSEQSEQSEQWEQSEQNKSPCETDSSLHPEEGEVGKVAPLVQSCIR